MWRLLRLQPPQSYKWITTYHTCITATAMTPAAVEAMSTLSLYTIVVGLQQIGLYSGVCTYTEVITARRATYRGCPNMKSDLFEHY